MPDRCLRCKQIRFRSTDDLWAKLKQIPALKVSLSSCRRSEYVWVLSSTWRRSACSAVHRQQFSWGKKTKDVSCRPWNLKLLRSIIRFLVYQRLVERRELTLIAFSVKIWLGLTSVKASTVSVVYSWAASDTWNCGHASVLLGLGQR